MADYGINFRDTSGYVTDGAGETYCLDPGAGDTYPTTRGGLTFGWQLSGGSAFGRDRNSGVDARLAGMVQFAHTNDPETADVRVDLTGDITLRIAAGDYSNQQWCNISIRDSVGEKIDLGVVDTIATTNWHDGAGTVRTSATDWINNNTAFASYSFTTYVLLRMTADNGESGNTCIAHLFLSEDAAGATGNPWYAYAQQ